jgi:phosphoribosyl 1,2-cyclic phosphodiesterase
MRLRVIGSGSSGNCYILENEDEALIIDAGVRFLEVKKALRFQVRKIVGVIITHKHGDHAAFAHEYKEAGIPVFQPYESESLQQNIRYGGFRIQSWEAVHNVQCVGYLIDHDDLGRMLYVTDTEYVKYRFKGITHFLIEANYSEDLVNKEEAKYLHVLTGHLELQTTIGCIQANQSELTRRIILCHLSRDNADPEAFRTAVEAIAIDGCIVDVATAGMTVEM